MRVFPGIKLRGTLDFFKNKALEARDSPLLNPLLHWAQAELPYLLKILFEVPIHAYLLGVS